MGNGGKLGGTGYFFNVFFVINGYDYNFLFILFICNGSQIE